MRGRWKAGLVMLAAIVIGSPAAGEGSGGSTAAERVGDLRVESYVVVPVDSLNARVSAAVGSGQEWPKDPFRLAVEVLHLSFVETRSIELRCEANRGEGADSVSVTVVEDGWLDDSARGMWQRLCLARQADGTWRVVELRQAWRCWRGHHQRSYSMQPCL
jgi:hypothetical protein